MEQNNDISSLINNMTLNDTTNSISNNNHDETQFNTEDDEITLTKWKRSAGLYGIPNYTLSINGVDLEDFVWKKIILPNIVFDELNLSGMKSYSSYFKEYCINSEDIIISIDTMCDIGELYDTIFACRIINYEKIGNIINTLKNELDESISNDNWLSQYYQDYVSDIVNGLYTIINMLQFYINNYSSDNHLEMRRLASNLCATTIYLHFIFNTNMFFSNNQYEDMLQFI